MKHSITAALAALCALMSLAAPADTSAQLGEPPYEVWERVRRLIDATERLAEVRDFDSRMRNLAGLTSEVERGYADLVQFSRNYCPHAEAGALGADRCPDAQRAIQTLRANIEPFWRWHLQELSEYRPMDAYRQKVAQGELVPHGMLEDLLEGRAATDPMTENYLQMARTIGYPAQLPTAAGGEDAATRQAIGSSMRSARFPRCQAVPPRVLRAVRATFSDRVEQQVVKACFDGGWDVRLGPRGRPVSRYRMMRVLAKGRGEDFCRDYVSIGIEQEAAGRGRWEDAYSVSAPQDQYELHVVRCR